MSNSTELGFHLNISEATEALPERVYTFLGAYLAVVAIFTFIGNSVVIHIFATTELVKMKVTIFIINIAIANLVEAFLGYPLAIISNFKKQWSFGDVGCAVYGFVVYLASVTMLATYCVLSALRYIVICQPSQMHMYLTKSTARLTVFLLWSYGLFWAISPLLGWGKYAIEPFGTSCSLDWTGASRANQSYIMSVFVFVLFIPVFLNLLFYGKIVQKIKSSVSVAPTTNSDHVTTISIHDPRHGVTSCGDEIQHTVLKNVTTLMLIFLVAWIPYGVMSMTASLGTKIPVNFTPIPTFLAKTNCAVNIFVFAFGFPRFRQELKRRFRLI